MKRILAVLALSVLLTAYTSAAPVNIHNDRIDVDGGNITEMDWLNPGGGAANIGGNLDMRGNSILSSTGTVDMGDNISMNDFWLKTLSDPVSSADAMTKGFADNAYLNRDGSDAMAGDLDMANNDIVNVKAMVLQWSNLTGYPPSCPAGEAMQQLGDTIQCVELDPGGVVNASGADPNQVAYFLSNDTVSGDPDLYFDVQNTELGIGTNTPASTIDVDGAANIRGNLSLNSNWIKSLHDPVSSADAMTKGFADTAYLNRDGTDAMAGNLDMSGYNILNVDALGNGTARTIQMDSSGNVDIPNGNLDLSGKLVGGTSTLGWNNLSGYPASCGAGQVVQAVGDTLTCVSKGTAGASGDIFVNESGDSMTGNLTMGSNWIKSLHDPVSSADAMTKGFADTAYLNSDGTDSMSGDLDVGNNIIINVEALRADGSNTNIDLVDGGEVKTPGGDVNVTGNNVTSHKEICMGDQCT